jgi:hypothetical protein
MFTEMWVKIVVLWDVAACSLLVVYHLQVTKGLNVWNCVCFGPFQTQYNIQKPNSNSMTESNNFKFKQNKVDLEELSYIKINWPQRLSTVFPKLKTFVYPFKYHRLISLTPPPPPPQLQQNQLLTDNDPLLDQTKIIRKECVQLSLYQRSYGSRQKCATMFSKIFSAMQLLKSLPVLPLVWVPHFGKHWISIYGNQKQIVMKLSMSHT